MLGETSVTGLLGLGLALMTLKYDWKYACATFVATEDDDAPVGNDRDPCKRAHSSEPGSPICVDSTYTQRKLNPEARACKLLLIPMPTLNCEMLGRTFCQEVRIEAVGLALVIERYTCVGNNKYIAC